LRLAFAAIVKAGARLTRLVTVEFFDFFIVPTCVPVKRVHENSEKEGTL